MRITILGSGAWEGIPAPFCSCRVCALAVQDPTSKDNRTRPQILIENAGGAFLLEVSPDIRLQSTKQKLLFMNDVFISHSHFDHMRGLYELHSAIKRSSHAFTVHCSKETAKIIREELSHIPLTINVLQPYQPYSLHGVTVTPLPVYHMFDMDDALSDDSLANTFAYLCDDGTTRVVYLADYYRIPKKTLDMIQGLDMVIADGTYLATEEFRDIKPNHMHGENILHFTKSLGAKNVYYHSISHLTRKTHDEMQKNLPPAQYAAYDGMRLL